MAPGSPILFIFCLTNKMRGFAAEVENSELNGL